MQQPNVFNPSWWTWGRNNIDGFRAEQQSARGAVVGSCFDDINNKGVAELA